MCPEDEGKISPRRPDAKLWCLTLNSVMGIKRVVVRAVVAHIYFRRNKPQSFMADKYCYIYFIYSIYTCTEGSVQGDLVAILYELTLQVGIIHISK